MHDQPVERRVGGHRHRHAAGVGVLGGVGERLAHDGDEAVAHVGRHVGCTVVDVHGERRAGVRRLPDLRLQVERVVVQVVHARAHAAHGLVQRVAHLGELAAHPLVVAVHHLQRLHLHDGAREQVPHVVVYLARDAPALGQRSQPHLEILLVAQAAVLLLERERRLLHVVAQAAVRGELGLEAARAVRQQKGQGAGQRHEESEHGARARRAREAASTSGPAGGRRARGRTPRGPETPRRAATRAPRARRRARERRRASAAAPRRAPRRPRSTAAPAAARPPMAARRSMRGSTRARRPCRRFSPWGHGSRSHVAARAAAGESVTFVIPAATIGDGAHWRCGRRPGIMEASSRRR